MLLALVLHAVLVAPVEETPWTWAGIEIFGNHTVPRAEIENRIPIPIGESYASGDAPFWKDACADVEKRLAFVKVVCGDRPLMVFPGRKVYPIVGIVEKGHERVLEFRAAPTGSDPFANDEMVTLSAELGKKTMAAAMAGHAYKESAGT